MPLRAYLLATISLLFSVTATADTPAMYLIHFEQIPVGDVERGIIDKASEPVLQNAIEVFESAPDSCMRLIGYYDRSGPARDRMKKSQILAESVADYLVARGIPAKSLTITWQGDMDADVIHTAVEETGNREVLVVVGFGKFKNYCS